MDSEDERYYELEDRDGVLAALDHKSWSTGCRLFERKEMENRLYEYQCHQRGASSERILPSIKTSSFSFLPDIPDNAAATRLIRFFKTFHGFYTGELDLAGRHQRRYISILKRWTEFANDMTVLERHAEEVQIVGAQAQDDTVKMAEYVINPALFNDFLAKWRIKNTWTFSMLLIMTSDMRVVIREWSPRFQKLCLGHLPPELIHRIMQFCHKKEARRLGSTCKMFQEISVNYIYSTYSLRLSKRKRREMLREKHGIDSILRASRSDMLAEINYLLSRDDILRNIRTLVICDEWKARYFRPSLFDDARKAAAFYRPLRTGVSNVISRIRQLTKVTVDHWHFTNFFAMAVLQHEELTSLEIISCTNGLLDPGWQFWTHILHLSLIISALDVQEAWKIVSALPAIRSLHIGVDMETPDTHILPTSILQGRINPFLTLERFIVYTIHYEELDDLISWMHAAKTLRLEPLRLTHFKLATLDGFLDEHDLSDLLNVLRDAPVQHLALDCLQYAEPELLDTIAETFPDLISLTIHYRTNIEDNATTWPYPSWVYALHLRNFSRLKHLGWNFSHKYENDPTTYFLHFFENGFPTLDEWNDHYADLDIAQFGDSYTVAQALGAYCPTLETVAFFVRSLPTSLSRRSQHGQRQYSNWTDQTIEDVEMYDPCSDHFWDGR
ncbi:unnamed protein product [Somion occarium]|uniref:F-box domain-containing protein n=1 Tax=Somion occarium TaxID=3059160 RepID=A0ABP1CTM5_9APHY